ncbi:MAG: citramalate synthase [Planctomycetes bacterium]|nr:citramalate synthase [Planctomycetota bacterium]
MATKNGNGQGVKKKGVRVQIFDTSLRDGTQSEHVAYSLDDKLQIAHELDRLGVDYIEAGWPGSNPKDMGFFDRAVDEKWTNAKITAFGSTRHPKNKPAQDPNLQALVKSKAPVLIFFGKTWDFHVTDALRVKLEDNVDMIRTSAEYLKTNCEQLLYDAEHFFDGYKHNRDYAWKTLDAAVAGGVETLVLCDTNGGTLPDEIARIVGEVKKRFGGMRLGIHPHNDSGVAIANALAAVEAGCTHVQGTINGFGERCGNVDLLPVIANLSLKLGYDCLKGDESVRRLTEVSRFVYEIGNLPPRDNQPYVGKSAFAHKGGIHVSAVNRNAATYEHVDPESVGNSRRVLISELSGRSNVVATQGERFGLKDRPEDLKKIVDRLMELENQGYVYEAAEASFDLLVRKTLAQHQPFFKLHGFRVMTDVDDKGVETTEATVKIEVGGQVEHTASDGNGPVNALDGALRKALEKFYPEVNEIRLTDYKVRVVNPKAATAAKVLVSIVSSDHKNRWTTVGVSENIIEASWHALVDSVEYKLYQTRGEDRLAPAAAAQAKRTAKAKAKDKEKKAVAAARR